MTDMPMHIAIVVVHDKFRVLDRETGHEWTVTEGNPVWSPHGKAVYCVTADYISAKADALLKEAAR